jgi:broad specificity phosphatase PhoE
MDTRPLAGRTALVKGAASGIGDLLLIRHAESTWNAAGRWQGHGDPPLSARGRAQAEALARALASLRPALVVTSDLARAIATGAPLAHALGAPAPTCPRLRELDVGSWTGLTREQIATRDPEALAHFESGADDAPAGGAETRAALARRAREALARLSQQVAERPIAVVTHLGVIRALSERELGHAEWIRMRSS